MPIALMCPSCSAGFNAKDEHAGRRAECPKCGQPLTIPGGPAPRAKPVPARRATPIASPPRPTRRRDEDEFEERPRSKRRRDDEDDEPPRKSRRRRENDEDGYQQRRRKDRAKEGSNAGRLWLIGGGTFALTVVLGLTVVAVVFLLPPGGTTTGTVPAGTGGGGGSGGPVDPAEKDRPAEQPPLVTSRVEPFVVQLQADRQKFFRGWVVLSGWVSKADNTSRVGRPGEGSITLGSGVFSARCYFPPSEWAKRPKFDDSKTYTVIGQVSESNPLGATLEWCRLMSESATDPAAERPIDVSAVELTREYAADPAAAEAKYKGKLVRLVGGATSEQGTGMAGGEYGGMRYDVFLSFRPNQPPRTQGLKTGDRLTVLGRVYKLGNPINNSRTLYVNDCVEVAE